MKTITVEYWQELPPIIGSLKRAFSNLVEEWRVDFNPTIKYYTSISFTDIQIRFRGTHWEESYHLFSLFCEEFNLSPSVDNYLWLMTHTNIVNNTLLGDEEFNKFVKDNEAYIEVEEFVENNELVIWHGEDLELKYNYEDMEMIKRLGMEIRPNVFQFRSKAGYYLPINIRIRYNSSISTLLSGLDKGSYQITHTPVLTIKSICPDGVFKLAKHLYKNSQDELMVKWATEGGGDVGSLVGGTKTSGGGASDSYTITLWNTQLIVEDRWRIDNKEMVRVAERIHKLSDYKVKAFRVLDILRHSTYSKSYGLKLDAYMFNKLRVNKEQLTRGLHEVSRGVFSEDAGAIGELTPISIQSSGIKLETPYKRVERGVYKESWIPLVNYTETPNINARIDTDLRIVLRKKSVGKEKLPQSDILEAIGGEQQTTLTPLDMYPRVEVDLDNLGIDYTEGIEREKRVVTGELTDLLYVPYILTLEEVGTQVKVIYTDGKEEVFSKTDPYLRSRIVFRDLIGLDIREGVEHFTELLISLGTDTLKNPKNIYEKLEYEGDTEAIDIIHMWLGTFTRGSINELYREVLMYDMSEEVEDDEDDTGDILEEFSFM